MPRAKIYAQGDILIERLSRKKLTKRAQPVQNDPDGAVVLEHGEFSGHRHVVCGGAALYRDEILARGVEPDLYVGHLHVTANSVTLRHEEHDPLTLPEGVYRIRRQREFSSETIGDTLVGD